MQGQYDSLDFFSLPLFLVMCFVSVWTDIQFEQIKLGCEVQSKNAMERFGRIFYYAQL